MPDAPLRWRWSPPARSRRAAPGRKRGPRPAVLVVDIGNSRVSVAVVHDDRVRGVRHLPARRATRATLTGMLREALESAGRGPGPQGAVLSSVVSGLTTPWLRALERTAGFRPMVAGADVLRDMPVRYRDPREIGPDRLANALAVRALYGTPAIVVDFGTATNFDCVSRDGEFLGGAIAPGVVTAADALYARAPRLARVTLRPQRRTLGHSTAEALRAGIVHGAAALVDGLVRRLADDMNARPHVIATGGLADPIVRDCQTVHQLDAHLTLKGLARMWEGSS